MGMGGYSRVTKSYDPKGEPVETAYYDAGGKLVQGPEGYAVERLARDEDGNLTDLTRLGANGEPRLLGGRCAHIHATYEGGKRIKTACVAESGDPSP